MTVKIIKDYTVREGKVWKEEMVVGVTNEFGAELIKIGFARELRIEKLVDDKGNEFHVQTEVIDDKGTTRSKKVDKEKTEK